MPARFAPGLHRVAEDVWAWLSPNGDWGEANAGLVAGEDAALVVDTLWDEALAGRMLGAMSDVLAGRPVRHVVNTHSDGDHWWGNGVMPDDAEILTGAASLAAMCADVTPAEVARMSRAAGAGARLPGPQRGMLRYVHAMLGPFEFGGVRLRFPDATFSGTHELAVGGRRVVLHEVGPAHTPGDAIVHVPDAGVVFAADVLFAGATPVMWFGPLPGWLAALDTLLGLDAAVYVPGHGPVADRAAVVEMRDYMTWLGETVREAWQAGAGVARAAALAVRSPEFARWRDWVSPARMLITVDTIHRGLRGEPPVGFSTTGRARLFWAVARFERELAAGLGSS